MATLSLPCCPDGEESVLKSDLGKPCERLYHVMSAAQGQEDRRGNSRLISCSVRFPIGKLK
jgi:hypothetical protein